MWYRFRTPYSQPNSKPMRRFGISNPPSSSCANDVCKVGLWPKRTQCKTKMNKRNASQHPNHCAPRRDQARVDSMHNMKEFMLRWFPTLCDKVYTIDPTQLATCLILRRRWTVSDFKASNLILWRASEAVNSTSRNPTCSQRSLICWSRVAAWAPRASLSTGSVRHSPVDHMHCSESIRQHGPFRAANTRVKAVAAGRRRCSSVGETGRVSIPQTTSKGPMYCWVHMAPRIRDPAAAVGSNCGC